MSTATASLRFAALMMIALAPVPASAATLRVFSAGAVPGAAIVAKNKLLDARSAAVTVGEQNATVLSAHRHRIRFVVPPLAPGNVPVVVTSGDASFDGSLRVLPPFPGFIAVTLDGERTHTEVIGAEGGTVSVTGADDTAYELEIPPGALAQQTGIALTPAADVRGLPLSRRPVAVAFGPDGLELAKTATLRVTFPDGVPPHAIGFTYQGDGEELAIEAPGADDHTIEIPVRHFSGAGAAGTRPEDMANLIAAELTSLEGKVLTIGETEELAGLVFRWIDLFGQRMCESQVQPICVDAANRVLDSIRDLLQARCPVPPAAPPAPTLGLISEILRIEDVRVQIASIYPATLDGTPDANACIDGIFTTLVAHATTAFVLFPLGSSTSGALAESADGQELNGFPSQKAIADVDADGEVGNAEWLIYLSVAAHELAGQASTDAYDAFFATMTSVLEEGKQLCKEDYEDGLDLLERGAAIAGPFGILLVEYNEAADECARIKVAPAAIRLAPGAKADFAATVNYDFSPDIRWAASGGTINETGNVGHFTAPQDAGEYTVTATDLLFPGVSGKATVVVCGAEQNFRAANADQCLADVLVNPAQASVGPGQTWKFSATVFDVIDDAVTWSATGGTIDASGLYTAGAVPGTYQVTATSVEDPTKKGTASVSIVTSNGKLDIYSRFAIASASDDCGSSVLYLPEDPFAPRHPPQLGQWLRTASGGCGASVTHDSTVDVTPTGTGWLSAAFSGIGGARLQVEFFVANDDVVLGCTGKGNVGSLDGVLEVVLFDHSQPVEVFANIEGGVKTGSFSVAMNRNLSTSGLYEIYVIYGGGEGGRSMSVSCSVNAPVIASIDDD